MKVPDANPALIDAIALRLVLASAAVYVFLVVRIVKRGGRVSVSKFGYPDLIVSGLLIACFASLAISGFNSAPIKIHDSVLVSNALFYYIILTLLCAFLHFRGIDVPAQFGLRAVRFDKVVGIAVLLLVAAYPMITGISGITQMVLQGSQWGDAKPQELVTFFKDALNDGHTRSIVLTLITGILVAPVVEEFIFRGFIYGILKRYLGVTVGVVLNAALFAAVHMNLASLPALMVLAMCLTLAYEYTGSILVNMCMHSLFNLTTFCALIYYSQHPLLLPQ